MPFVLTNPAWTIKFKVGSFEELSLVELYHLMALRQEVFVVEQDCPYLDADGKDFQSYHVLGYQEAELVAYTRIVPPGISYPTYTSIGRVVTSRAARRSGLGKMLMAASIEGCERIFPEQAIKISAQTYLLDFYQGFGFDPVGEGYLEDGIPHQGMVRPHS
ncbi:MAG: GNAT family N-acetyltransferase [Bacteroidota bacterium]